MQCWLRSSATINEEKPINLGFSEYRPINNNTIKLYLTNAANGRRRIENEQRTSKKVSGLVKAFAGGYTIQYYHNIHEGWKDTDCPDFDSATLLYRIKPEPQIYYAAVLPSGARTDIYDSEDKALAELEGKDNSEAATVMKLVEDTDYCRQDGQDNET